MKLTEKILAYSFVLSFLFFLSFNFVQASTTTSTPISGIYFENQRSRDDYSWSDLVFQASSTSSTTINFFNARTVNFYPYANVYGIVRSALQFDTASIPTGSIITGAKLYYTPTISYLNPNEITYAISLFSYDVGDLSLNDYSNFGSTNLSDTLDVGHYDYGAGAVRTWGCNQSLDGQLPENSVACAYLNFNQDGLTYLNQDFSDDGDLFVGIRVAFDYMDITPPVGSASDFNISLDDLELVLTYTDPPLSITSPYNNENLYFQSGQTQTVSGTCKNNGTDRLRLVQNIWHNAYDTKPESSAFPIDCINNSWTATYQPIYTGSNTLLIYDTDFWDSVTPFTTTDSAFSYYTGNLISGTGDYSFFLDYPNPSSVDPLATSTPILIVVQATSSFPFIWNISSPLDDMNASTTQFSVEQVDSSWASANPATMIFDDDLDSSCSFTWGCQITTNIVTTFSTIEHYIVKLYSHNILQQIRYYTVTGSGGFDTPGGVPSDPEPEMYCDPDDDDTILYKALQKVVCWAIIGDQHKQRTDWETLKAQVLVNKQPFALWLAMKNTWLSARSANATSTLSVNFDTFGAFTGTDLEDFTWNIIDLRNPGWSEAHWKVFTFIETFIMPLIFGYLVFLIWARMIKNFGQ